MRVPTTSQRRTWPFRRQPWLVRALIALTGVVCATATLATPADASPIDDAFLGALQNAGVNYGDPGNAVTLGQSVCPILARRGGNLAEAASTIRGNSGMSATMTNVFTTIAIQMYCPSMMTSLANGNLPDIPFVPGL